MKDESQEMAVLLRKIREHRSRRVVARRPTHLAAGMRPGTAQVEAGYRRAVRYPPPQKSRSPSNWVAL